MGLPNGKGAREHAKFRLTRNGEVAVAMTNEDEANIETLEVTASGDTLILPSPGSAEYLTIKGFHFSNDGAKVTVGLRAGTGGKEKFSTTLIANGGNFDKNLIGRYWRLPINKALYVVLSGAGNVLVTIEYEGMEEPGPESVELTDALSIVEAVATQTDYELTRADAQALSAAVAKTPEKKPSDSIVIAEALVSSHYDATKDLADSLSIAEANVRTGDRFVNLSESLVITESTGNQTTTELTEADTLSIAASVVVSLIPG